MENYGNQWFFMGIYVFFNFLGEKVKKTKDFMKKVKKVRKNCKKCEKKCEK